jgi:hypothetical protein
MSRLRSCILVAVAAVALLGGTASAQSNPDDIGRAISDLARILGGVQQGLRTDDQACNLALVRVDQHLRAAASSWTFVGESRHTAAAQRWIAVYGQYNCNPGPLLRLLEVHEPR